MSYPAISLATATVGRHRCPQKRLQTAPQPPGYPNSSPDHRACNSLTPFRCPHAVHPCPSVDSGLGARRQVHVLDGECFAVRREYWVGVLDRYLNQRFWGVRPVSGDDGWITTLLLEDGWQTAYQENARVHTYAPASFGVLLRQQLRWTRNSVRRSWYVLSRGVAFRTGAPFTVHTLAYLLKAPTFAALLVLALGRSFGQWQLGSDGVNSAQQLAVPLTEAAVFSGGIAGLAALVTGLTLTKVIRGIPRYQRGRLTVDLLLVPRMHLWDFCF